VLSKLRLIIGERNVFSKHYEDPKSFVLLQTVIVKLKMDKDRKKIIDRRSKGRLAALGKEKGKYTEESAAATAMETS
jgi:hypothetical protein